MPAVERWTAGRTIFNIFNIAFVLLFTLFCLYPFLLSLMVSITKEDVLRTDGYRLFPRALSLESYQFIFREGSRVGRSYQISIFVTVVGTALSLFVTAMLSYVLTHRGLRYSGAISFFVFFTMIFSGGLAPWYLVVTGIGLRDTVWAMILPALVNAWFVFILRTFFRSIPDSIPESARIDGASEITIFLRLMLPLSVPGIATIALFYAIGYWNDWWLAILFLSKRDLYPLQYLLRVILQDVINAIPRSISLYRPEVRVPEQSVRMATMMVTIGPIIVFYPFAQRYFVKGIIVGAIKG
jgi:ABC-type glycerol-3-phosphate transport system permease component